MFPRLNSCFGCISLRLAAVLVAIQHFVDALGVPFLGAKTVFHMPVAGIVFAFIIEMLLGIILLYAICTIHLMSFKWYIWLAWSLCLVKMVVAVIFVVHCRTVQGLIPILYVLLVIYFTLVVNSYYMQLLAQLLHGGFTYI